MDKPPYNDFHSAPVGSEYNAVLDTTANEKSTYPKETGSAQTSDVAEIENVAYGGKGTFDDAGLIDHYNPIESYEGAHRFDPDFKWDVQEEKKLIRRLDWRICAWCCLTFFSLQLDRGNYVQANADNMLGDINVNTNDYNTAQTIFYVSFLAAELPSQLISKKIGPDNWIPIQMICWSIVASFQAFIQGRTSLFICRALLGLFEGGFIPDTILYLSYFYTSKKLPIRLSFFWGSYQFTSIIGAFMAFGILHMAGVNGFEGWRWLFALEGTLTGLIGVITWFYLPASPTQTASWFRGKDGWFTEREEKIMVNRILRDDPSKGDMHNRQALTFHMLWKCLKDWDMWPIYLLGLSWMLPSIPMTAYLTLILKSEGFSTFHTNLLTIPAYVMFILNLVFWTWMSERVNQRILLCIVSQIWCLPCLIALEVLPSDVNKWAKWALAVLVVGYPYIHPVLVAITSRNAGSVRTRTVASALYNMCVQASNIVGSNIYRQNDALNYRTGNKILLALVAYNICLFVGSKLYYVKVNKRRETIWNEMTIEQKEEYLRSTADEGNKRLDFRFAH